MINADTAGVCMCVCVCAPPRRLRLSGTFKCFLSLKMEGGEEWLYSVTGGSSAGSYTPRKRPTVGPYLAQKKALPV